MASHSIFTTRGGEVYVWGENYMGSLGLGETENSRTPKLLSTLPPGVQLTSLACGAHHVVALTSDSQILVWGRNDDGQLGLSDFQARHVPTPLELLSEEKIIGVAAGGFHSMAITEGGGLWTWGDNSHGQLGQGGEMVGTTRSPSPQKINIPEPVTQASGGRDHSLVLTKYGNVYVFGHNNSDQLGLRADQLPSETALTALFVHPENSYTHVHVPLRHPLSDVLQVACSCYNSVVLTKDGRVHFWGALASHNSKIAPPPSLEDVVAVAAGTYHALALLSDGTLVGCGGDEDGQLAGRSNDKVGGVRWRIPRERVAGIACGWNTSYVVTEEGSLFSWGMSWKLGTEGLHGDHMPVREVEEEGGERERWKNLYPFLVALPRDNKKKILWDKIFYWIFLARMNFGSPFSGFPLETIFHIVNMYWK
jgi:alpha-tubulin suppressor-like RCC1 family protein